MSGFGLCRRNMVTATCFSLSFWSHLFFTRLKYTRSDISICPRVINTPAAFRAIAGPKGNIRKKDTYKLFQPWSHTASTLQSIDIMEHGRKRKVLNHVFSDKSLREFKPFVLANVERWCSLISQKIPKDGGWSSSINMAPWITYLTFDIMGDLCMGKSFGLKEAENTTIRHVLFLLEGIMKLFQPVS